MERSPQRSLSSPRCPGSQCFQGFAGFPQADCTRIAPHLCSPFFYVIVSMRRIRSYFWIASLATSAVRSMGALLRKGAFFSPSSSSVRSRIIAIPFRVDLEWTLWTVAGQSYTVLFLYAVYGLLRPFLDVERRRVLVARVVRRALGALCDVQDARQLLCHLKVRVRVEVPVGAKGCLNLLVSKALL